MEDVKIIIAFLWVATMLIYLLGDVIRIFAGDFSKGEMAGQPMKSSMWVIAAGIMAIPIVMIVLTVTLVNPINKVLNIIMALFFILFNLAGIKGYKAYDQLLLIVSFSFNFLVIFYAWTWV